MSLCDERKQWEQEALAVPLPRHIDTKKESIAGVECVWITEKTPRCNDVTIYIHGGGLISGSAYTHQNCAAGIVSASGTNVLLVNYRFLPENEYPAPLDDILMVYHTVLSDGIYTSNQIVIGGDSSGGGLALASLVQLRDLHSPMPRCIFTLSGAFDMTLSSDCMLKNSASDTNLSRPALMRWQQDYLKYDLESPLLSPVFSSLSNLPPILLLAGAEDPWLCDSQTVARKVRQEGGEVQLKVWETMGHVWIMDPALRESQEAFNTISGFMRSSSRNLRN